MKQEPPGFCLLENWNRPWSGITDAFAALTPLFTCMADGYYLLEDRELYPTDGNGHFFWAATDHSSSNPRTVAVWDPEYCSFSDTAPCFLLPGQPPSHFNPERATFYRDKPDARALAWYLPIPISAFCSTDTIRLLPPRAGRATAQNTVLSTATHFNDEQQTLVFPGVGNVCTKQSCNTTYQNSPRAKHYRPAHGRVSDKHISPSETWSEELKAERHRCPRWIKPGKLLSREFERNLVLRA